MPERIFDSERKLAGARAAGFGLFLAAIGMLFASSMVGYLVIRHNSAVWPPPGSPALPVGLWLSTVIILLSSITMQFSLYSARQGRIWAVKLGLLATSVMGFGFLTSQYFNWLALIKLSFAPGTKSLHSFSFYFLTGLHGLHVLGGLVPLFIITAAAFAGRITGESHTGVHHTAVYWLFLCIVGLVMFAALFLY